MSPGFTRAGGFRISSGKAAPNFVTFRQAGTLPREVLLQFKAEREAILAHALAAKLPLTWQEQEELFRWHSDRVDRYLDCCHGECHLRNRGLRGCSGGRVEVF